MIRLLAAGSNARGQLANLSLDDSHSFSCCSFSRSDPGTLPSDTRRIVQLVSGANHTLVLLERSSQDTGEYFQEIWGSGDGSKGQLGPSYLKDVESAGDSTTVFRPINLPLCAYGLEGYTYRLIAASWETSYVVLSCPGKNDILISMGVDDFGDLGTGSPHKGKSVARPFHVVKLDHLAALKGSVWEGGLVIESLATGPHHVVAHLKTTSSPECLVVGWGASRHGELGKASTPAGTGRPTPFLSIPQVIPIEQSDTVSLSALGNQHTIFLHTSGRLTGLGSNRKNQLHDVTSLKGVRGLGCTWNGTYAIVAEDDSETHIFATGASTNGQLGRPMTTSSQDASLAPVQFPFTFATHRLLNMVCGSEHVLAVFSVAGSDSAAASTEVWGWGWNEHGNLGIGSTTDVHLPARIWPNERTAGQEIQGRVISVWAGCGTSWIALQY